MGFFSEIYDGIKNLVGGIENAGGSVYKSIDSKIDLAEKTVSKIPDTVESLGGKIIDTGENIGDKVLDTGKGIISGVENTIFIPLIIIAGGLLFFMKNQNGDSLSNIARSASQSGPMLV